MKSVLFVLLFICTCADNASAQKADCRKFKNGTFSITDHGITTIISRSGTEQSEFYNGSAKPTTYSVKWLDECTYVLTPHQDVFDKYPDMPKNALLTVRIINTSANSYTQTSTSNFSDLTFTAEMVKIK